MGTGSIGGELRVTIVRVSLRRGICITFLIMVTLLYTVTISKYCIRAKAEGVFLDVIGTKILRFMLHVYSQSPPAADFTPPYGFLGLEISTTTAESGWRLGFDYIISSLPLKIALFFLLLHLIIYLNIYFPYRNNN